MPLYTTTQCARYLQLSDVRIRQLCQSGQLPARKLGTQWVVELTDLEKFARIDRPAGRRCTVSA